MDTTENLNLPYIMPSQAQKHVTHNEALRMLDALVQVTVATRTLAAPPESPADGARYIVAAGANGAWTGQEGKLAAWQDGAWSFYAPLAGWLAYVADEERLVAFTEDGWQDAAGIVLPDRLGINATADAPNRLALAGAASLFSHEGAGHQLKINKATAADTASLLFQTGYSGRAEFGLAGDDNFHVKVSPDGASWKDAMIVDRLTGRITFPAGIAGTREQLAANRAYYVGPAGSDANDGLSSGTAFKTIGKALAVAGGLDCSIYNLTIQVADGTYAEAVSLPQMLGSGTFTLQGNSANPGNCVLSPSSGRPLAAIGCGAWTVRGFTFTPATGVADCVYAADATKLTLANPVFSPVNGYQLRAERGAVAIFSGTVTIDGGANYHVACNNATVQAVSTNYVIEGTPRFNTAFFSASNAGMVQCNGMTYAGSATGRRYFVITNGVVNSYGGGENFLPGDAAGATQTGGVYA